VLGADPPPLAKVEIYRFFMFFYDFRAFNTAGKTVTKIGIYSKPPPKSGPKTEFLAILSIFPIFGVFLIIRDPFRLNLIFSVDVLLIDHYPIPFFKNIIISPSATFKII
jgi:hypothetical protein